MNHTSRSSVAVAATAVLSWAAACSAPAPRVGQVAARIPGEEYLVRDTTVQATFDAAGVAAPLRQATLSTKLLGTVLEVLVREGDAVASGQPLVRIDARDIAAKQSQASASVAEAETLQRDAQTQAGRIRALYADSAATRAQLDAVEVGVARADAGVRAARAAVAELGAVSDYSVIRAPFAGIVTRRFVDPGAFAAPGSPLVSIQDGLQLRITAAAPPELARGVRARQRVDASIEGRPVEAIVEGVVPSAGNMYSINALVPNPGARLLAGSAATLRLPVGARTTMVVPAAAVVRQGDLTGVTVRTPEGDVVRWVRVGQTFGDVVEVNAGLLRGDRVVVPRAPSAIVGGAS